MSVKGGKDSTPAASIPDFRTAARFGARGGRCGREPPSLLREKGRGFLAGLPRFRAPLAACSQFARGPASVRSFSGNLGQRRQGREAALSPGFSAAHLSQPPAAVKMESIEELALGPCTASPYLRPFRLRYRQNGVSKTWDFMRTHDSVSILIFNASRQCFVVVKQFRPAVYMCEMERQCPQDFASNNQESWCPLPARVPASVGITYELCAGIVDKPELSLEEIACEEVLEECGYSVPIANLKKIASYRAGVGVTGSKQTLFYAEVTDGMKTGEGGGQPQEGELIEVVEIPLQDSMSFAFDETFPKTMGVIFSFMWFQNNVAPKLLEK
ncbi:uridine diphosphate glucose pyrophosphatase NUDT14 [Hemicordylus capensis]|uniref:uridine diphosphate glucose pyrophosphatase NUDT14 n=1 Tax=Hemicordylus capensis TaxID=884348 RepID=UPI0023048C77|nr:uridine diphosphate glucose pyrophosphatase NUDT14 [Hemicordylus capensis]